LNEAEKILTNLLNKNELKGKTLITLYLHLIDLAYRKYDFLSIQKYMANLLDLGFQPKHTLFYDFILAQSYMRTNNYKLAIDYFKTIYRKAKANHDYLYMSSSLNEISNIYYFQRKNIQSLRFKKYAVKFLKLSKDAKPNNFFYIYFDMAYVYKNLKDYQNAFKTMETALSYFVEDLLRPAEIQTVYISLSEFALLNNEINKAENYLNKVNLRFLSDYLKYLYYLMKSKIYYTKKDFKKAFKYRKQSFIFKEKSFDKNRSKKITELNLKYDIERKKHENEIYRLENIELRKINLSKDKFFSIVAHDLRSPFATISSFISLMKKHQKNISKEKMFMMIEELEKIVLNSYSLLENLLQWSRFQTGTLQYNPEKLNLKDVINETVNLISSQAKIKRINIITKIRKNHIIYADRFMIETIIRNLLNNAIKFSYPDSEIIVFQRKINNYNKIFVKDFGLGMDIDTQKKLFQLEKSFSTKGTNQEKGTGLGLILCKEFAEKNKGKIGVKSTLGKGSIFYFTVPLKND
jgi:signal transduction histidine kinase